MTTKQKDIMAQAQTVADLYTREADLSEILNATAKLAALFAETKQSWIEAYGVMGMNSAGWRKTFKSLNAMNKWVELTGATVHGSRDVEPSL